MEQLGDVKAETFQYIITSPSAYKCVLKTNRKRSFWSVLFRAIKNFTEYRRIKNYFRRLKNYDSVGTNLAVFGRSCLVVVCLLFVINCLRQNISALHSVQYDDNNEKEVVGSNNNNSNNNNTNK